MNSRRLFVASCIALVASAFSFVTRGDILPALGSTFDLNQENRGAISGAAFLGMAVSMFVGAPICDALGLKRMLGLAFLCHIAGSLLTVGSPYIVPSGSSTVAFYVLWAAMFLVGSANGFVEIGINPLTTTIYSKEKTHMLNVLHAWWPGGLFIGGLLASILINKLMGLPGDGIALVKGAEVEAVDANKTMLGWQLKAGLVFIPTLIYGALFLYEKFPVDRASQGWSVVTLDVHGGLPPDVHPLGDLHAHDRVGRAGAAAVAELGADEDVEHQRDLHSDVYERDHVRAPPFRGADRSPALSGRNADRLGRPHSHRPLSSELRRQHGHGVHVRDDLRARASFISGRRCWG